MDINKLTKDVYDPEKYRCEECTFGNVITELGTNGFNTKWGKCPDCNGTGKKQINIAEFLMRYVMRPLFRADICYENNHVMDWDEYYRHCNKSNTNKTLFECLIRNRFEDNLSQSIIAICELCGYFGVLDNIEQRYANVLYCSIGNVNIAEWILDFQLNEINLIYINIGRPGVACSCIAEAIGKLQMFCQSQNIDIEKHIEARLKYQKEREG
jgi:hypothetical protein